MPRVARRSSAALRSRYSPSWLSDKSGSSTWQAIRASQANSAAQANEAKALAFSAAEKAARESEAEQRKEAIAQHAVPARVTGKSWHIRRVPLIVEKDTGRVDVGPKFSISPGMRGLRRIRADGQPTMCPADEKMSGSIPESSRPFRRHRGASFDTSSWLRPP